MADTPLRRYLQEAKVNAEEFAAEHGFSPWNVRHWSRGDKVPVLETQQRLDDVTGGKVTPSDWLTWSLARPRPTPADEQGRAAA